MMIKHLGTMVVLACLFIGATWQGLAWAKMNKQAEDGRIRSYQTEDEIWTGEALLTKTNVFPWINLDDKDEQEPILRQLGDYPYVSYRSADLFFPPYPSANERLGYNKAVDHDTTELKAGWYMDWGSTANPKRYNGIEYARTIYFSHDVDRCRLPTNLSQINAVTGTALINRVKANPGALWMVGNEPDSYFNGSPLSTEFYARLYHYYYTTIKETDPLAKVSPASVVQPSPLRIAYLGKILDHYETLYQEKMPSDFWQIHLYRFSEKPCYLSGGVGIPPESLSEFGWQFDFEPENVLNVEAIMNSVRDFRQWMRDEGYREQPLIISEFGVLPSPDYTGFSEQVAANFLTEIFNRLLTETDADIGYPADENRLVQAWAWYSTDDSVGNRTGYGGDLFNSNGQLTVIGQAFKEIAEANYTPYVDLQVIPSAEKIAVSNNIIPLTFYVENRGNITATASSVQIEVRSLDQNTIFSSQTVLVSELSPRYRQTPLLVSEDISPPQGVDSVSIVVTLNHPEDVNVANDVLTIEVEIPNLDLSLDAIEIMSLGVFNSTQENTVRLKSTVNNVGNVASTQTNLSIRVQEQDQVNPVILPTVVMPSLNPNMSATLTTTWQITGMGRYTIEATVNNPAQPDFVEDRFDNNHKKITENFKPDLSLDRLTLSPVQPSDGDEGETTKYITVTVSNQGNWPAPQTTWFLTIQEMMQGQNNLTTTPAFMMPEIGLNQSQSFSTALAITDIGTYRITSTVNLPSQPSFDELDFTNNQREAMMVIKPDLEVSRIEVSPLRVLGAVEPNIVTITINNVGTWVAPTTTLTLFEQRIDQDQDKLLKSFNLAKTRIGLQHRLTTTWPITEAGAYQIEARVNVDQPPEFDEHSFENNWAKGGLIAVQNDDNITVVTPNVATNFVSQGPTTTIVIPSQAVTESIALSYTSLISPSLATPTKWHFVNRAFRLNVYQSEVLITEFDFIQPLTVTLVYSDEALATANAALEGAPLLEENMRLYQRHNDVWRLAGATCGLTTNTQVDVVANLVSTQICQSGEFTLFAVNFESLYLPLVFK